METLTKEKTIQEKKLGFFHACYQIGIGAPGAPVINLNLGVSTVDETVGGIAKYSWAVNPPVNRLSLLQGSFNYMCVMPKNCHILVTAQGFPYKKSAEIDAIPIREPNFKIYMVLTEDWKSGEATISFKDESGAWHEFKNLPVKEASC